MKKLMKLSVLGVGVLLLVLSLRGSTTVSANNTDLVFMHWETPAHRISVIEKLLKKFEKESGIKVEQNPTAHVNYDEKLFAGVAANMLPDVLWVNPTEFTTLLDLQVLIPIDEIFSEIDAREHFFETCVAPYTVNGTHYATPIYGIAMPLTYRTDLYKKNGLEPPVYWEDLLESAEKLHAPDQGIYGMGLPVSTKGNYGSQVVWGFMSTNRARIISIEDGKERVIFNSPETIETYEFLTKLAKYTPPGAENMDWGMAERMIRTGKFANIKYASSPLRQLDETNPELAKKYGMTFLPRPRDGIIAHTGYPRGFLVTKTAKNKMEAVRKFFNWIYKPENYAQLLRMEDVFFLPVTSATANSKEFLEIPLVKKYRDMATIQSKALETIKVIGFTPEGFSLKAGAIEGSYMLGAVFQKIVLHEWPIKKAVEWGTEKYREIIGD